MSHCWGTLRKEGAPRRLLYLNLICFLKRCNLRLCRFLFIALVEVVLKGFFHFLRRSVNFLLVLEGLGGAAEIHRIAAVPLLTEYIRNRG
jgi:hypothetical protein